MPRLFDTIGPDGRPLRVIPHQQKAYIGDEALLYFTSRGFGRRPKDSEGMEELIFQHDLMVYALIREVIELRKRCGLESPIIITP